MHRYHYRRRCRHRRWTVWYASLHDDDVASALRPAMLHTSPAAPPATVDRKRSIVAREIVNVVIGNRIMNSWIDRLLERKSLVALQATEHTNEKFVVHAQK